MAFRRRLILDAALLGLTILATRAALIAHEAGGHALAAWLLGAKSIRIRLSPLGGGWVTAFFAGRNPEGLANLWFALSGIAINLLTGAAAWWGFRRMKGAGALRAFLLLFGAGSVAGGIWYLAAGFYFRTGDPAVLLGSEEAVDRLRWLWLLGLPAYGAVGFFAARDWSGWLRAHVEAPGWGRRILAAAGTLGAVIAAYGALWWATWNSGIDTTLRQQRVQAEIRREEARRRPPPVPVPAAPPPPAASPRPVPSPVPLPPVTAADVADRVPSPAGPILLALAGVAGFAFGLRREPPPPEVPAGLDWRWAIPPVFGAVVAGVIWIASRGRLPG